MKQFDAAVAAIRSYGVAPSSHGIQRWYVYRAAEATGGEIPSTSLTFFSREKAQRACDELNARAVIEMWRHG